MPYGARLAADMTRRLGRECLFTPSARLALYLALRRWCRPGGRVLMSPVNDDVILFVVLAAGLRPVQAPVSAADGNIDPDAVPETVWRGVDAVLTTNLYGIPDRIRELRSRCDELGIPLFEDAAHAIGTHVDGQAVGTFGTAGVFSLGKHVQGKAGGFLAVGDARTRRELERLRDDLLLPARLREDVATALLPLARSAVRTLHLVRPVWRAAQRLGLLERSGYRMPLEGPRLAVCGTRAPNLPAYSPWLRVDLHSWRDRHGPLVRGQLALRLAALDGDLARRRVGVDELTGTTWASPALREHLAHEGPLPLFRAPLLVHDRDVLADRLVRYGLVTGYLYDPPLDDYAGLEFSDPSPSPEAARWFAAHVLPADPLQSGPVIRALQREGARAARFTPSTAAEQLPRELDAAYPDERAS
ncbi:DegT/DnrJ/EryC1/StrS aminotransferase family protein [Streptomyces sp. TRM66268-LWL]|uniref:DegT/DnrJ/EryC1/StrS aminotransferase family protein n=1 Tax=Streptomyces polyasparticus TaxID=2767826 RepID=A0ABR7SUD2_9ACTN|nr:DegT/DnrJ/EryC1/StrS family aminotransferase [Streptomyces polyasparticus]MBC9719013.1 DegT/DnrJ/EryC1/StrS aminotransferase family protein [Streptomyces polyasparticus]